MPADTRPFVIKHSSGGRTGFLTASIKITAVAQVACTSLSKDVSEHREGNYVRRHPIWRAAQRTRTKEAGGSADRRHAAVETTDW